jgi:hypothetical protein
MCRHVGLLHRPGAADIRQIEIDARHELADRLNHAAARQHVERLAIEHLCVHGRRGVDDRRLTSDSDRLRELADIEIGIHRGRELGGQ